MSHTLIVLAQDSGQSAGGGIAGMFVALIQLAIVVLVLAGMWKTFVKAGQPGWACLIPIYNAYILLKIAGRPGWWLLLLFIPLVNLAILIVVGVDVAKRFGKGAGFGVGLALLGFIFYPILGFGDATYTPPAEPRGFAVIPSA